MGEVYCAHDDRLKRDVALKILPQGFAVDIDRMARFEREAKVLASLNHPHIASLYGLEDSGDTRALVMELVRGPTLADHLKQGPLSLEEALPFAQQIAEALEYAHERGIVHRDLKPANVKITPDGQVKVLDFGLAKALVEEGMEGAPLDSPTLTSPATRVGVLLGTAAYMAPEQARGKRVDRHADIWAFGCVLYEMLTGERSFAGETTSDTLASIIRADPEWKALPPNVPPSIRRLLERCLEKDPKRRLQAIGDARIELEEARAKPRDSGIVAPVTVITPVSHPRHTIVWAVAGLVVGGIVATAILLTLERRRAAPAPIYLSIALPPGQSLDPDATNPTVSADGTEIAYVARVAGGSPQIWLRNLDDFAAKPIPGTEGAANPFFSPDGEWLGFFASEKLLTIAVSGGAPHALCDVSGAGFGAWGEDGNIYFNPSTQGVLGLRRISAAGGQSQPVVSPDITLGELTFERPQVIPGQQELLVRVLKGFGAEQSAVAVLSLKTGKHQTILEGAGSAFYVAPHYLFFARSGGVWGISLDLQHLRVVGTPTQIIEGVSTSDLEQFAVSTNGSLFYIPGGYQRPERQLVEVSRWGEVRFLTPDIRGFEDLALSPDGQRLALTIEGPEWSIWTYDLRRNTLNRLTFQNDNRDPYWTADGQQVVYTSLRNGKWGLYSKAADASGPEQQLISSNDWTFGSSFSPDGSALLFTQFDPVSGADIWLRSRNDSKQHAFLKTPFHEWFPQFSPDGRWFAYESNESGRPEIYVRPFPGLGGKWLISAEGGIRPVWPHSAHEIFYINGGKLMTVPVRTSPTFSAGTARVLFDKEFFASGHYYDASPDGQHLFFIKNARQTSPPTQINAVLNVVEELERRMRLKGH
jgi:serine/threonine-protein kinase